MPDTSRVVKTSEGGQVRYEGWKSDGWKPKRGLRFPDPATLEAGTSFTIKETQDDRTVTFTGVPLIEKDGVKALDLDQASMATWTQ